MLRDVQNSATLLCEKERLLEKRHHFSKDWAKDGRMISVERPLFGR